MAPTSLFSHFLVRRPLRPTSNSKSALGIAAKAPSTSLKNILLATAFLLSAGSLCGQEGARRAPSLDQASPALERLDAVAARLAAGGQVGAFFAVHGDEWQVTWDRRSDRPHLIQGQGVPLIPGRGNALRRADLALEAGQKVDLDVVAAATLEFVDAWRPLLGVEGMDLRLDDLRSGGPLKPGALEPTFWNIELQQFVGEVPVVGARVFARISHGNAVQWGTIQVADVGLDPRPRKSRDYARRLAGKALSRVVANPRGLASSVQNSDQEWSEVVRGELEIVVVSPNRSRTEYEGLPGLGYAHRLVWRFEKIGPDNHRYMVRVDAHNGEIVEMADKTDFSDATVRGDVYRSSRDEALSSQPLANLRLLYPGNPVTDADGVYDYQGDTATARLAGPYVEINDNCGASSLSDAIDGNIDFGASPGTDCSTPGFGGGGNTNSARTAFYNLNRARDMAIAYFPFMGWLHEPLVANMNINDTCNAFWNGLNVNFFVRDPFRGCRNFGEVPGVVFHEWGHGFDGRTGSLFSDKGTGEAFGDTIDLLLSRRPCHGEGAFDNPCPTCTSACTGTRDIGAVAINGQRTIARPDTVEAPDGLDCGRFACPYYGSFFPYQGPMGYEGHCESLIASSANWDLAQQLITVQGEEPGWQSFTDLWMASVQPAQSAYRLASGGQCNPAAEVDGCAADNWYTVYLAVDDDDGNLANSTPNGCRLYAAFNAHGIACGEPMPCTDDCSPQPFPDAGPVQQICLGESAEIGTPALPDHTYEWMPGGETTAQIVVTPTTSTTYEIAATTSCSTFTDSTTVFVDDGSGIGLDEEFELQGADDWTLSGLWHLAESSDCVDPSATSGTNAIYFGRPETCDYDLGVRVEGDAISPQVDGIDATSILRFDYFLEVEDQVETSYDRFSVSIRPIDDPGWVTVWSRDSSDAATGVWQTSEGISLAEWAGKSLQIRFRFDSIDSSFNRFRGVFIDNAIVTAVAVCDYPPRVTVAAPVEGSIFENGSPIAFSARAFDREDGLLSDSLDWSSDRDGAFGSGGEVMAVLSPGPHEITASVSDSAGGLGAATLGLEVVDATPILTILEPAEGATVETGTPILLQASASDFEDGDLSGAIVWSSDLDGALGSGAEITASLSAGIHLLSAAATDSAGQRGEATRQVEASAPPNLEPSVTFLAPTDGSIFAAGPAIAFSATASDPEDGDLSASILWTSSLDGALGAGGAISSPLSVGVHIVDAAVTDSDGDTATASITVIVTPDGAPPQVLSLTSLAAEDGYLRESAAGSGVGGVANAAGGGTRALRLGDASGDRQFRSVLSFDTSALPAAAQILEVRLQLRRGRLIGEDPFALFGACRVDIQSGFFGSSENLDAEDFAAPPSVAAVAELTPAAADGELSEAIFEAAGRDALNADGRTQVRLAFEVATNADADYDYIGYWSGEAAFDDRPRLIITYVEAP